METRTSVDKNYDLLLDESEIRNAEELEHDNCRIMLNVNIKLWEKKLKLKVLVSLQKPTNYRCRVKW